MRLAVRSRSSPCRKAARLHVTRGGPPPQLQGRRGQAAPSATVAAPATTVGRDSRFLGDSPVNACAARSGTPTGTTRGAGGSDADIWLTVIGGSVLAFMLPPKAPGAWHPTPWRATGHDVAELPDPGGGRVSDLPMAAIRSRTVPAARPAWANAIPPGRSPRSPDRR